MKYIRYTLWTIFLTLILMSSLMLSNMLNWHLGYYYAGTIAIKPNAFTNKNIKLIRNIFKYYDAQFVPCRHNIIVKYVDLARIPFDNSYVIGLAKMYNNIFIPDEILIATKDRDICDIIETTIHELEHSCYGVDDCYGETGCWAYKNYANKYKYCLDVQTLE